MKDQRTILITGASSGIGEAIASELVNQGHIVVGIARNFDKSYIKAENFFPFTLDLEDLDSIEGVLKDIVSKHPNLDTVIFSAGSGRFGGLEEFSYRQINDLITINLISQICVARSILPSMKKKTSGDLIFIGSEAALAGGKRGAVYSATKFGVRGFAQSLREECATSNVRVSIINPGMVKTPFFDSLSFEPGQESENYILPEDVAQLVNAILMCRGSTVIDEINLSPLKKAIHFKGREENQ